MKFTPSILIAELSGAAGSAVASRWKGRGYFRSRVTPANPRSADQTTQRNFMSKVVGWWHDLKDIFKDPCDDLGASWEISGFNAFVARNLKDMADGVDERIMPLNTPTNPIDNLTAITGAGLSGDIDLTWDQGEAEDGLPMFALVEKTATPAGQSAIALKMLSVPSETEAATISGLDADVEYAVWALVNDTANGGWSIARKKTATSKA